MKKRTKYVKVSAGALALALVASAAPADAAGGSNRNGQWGGSAETAYEVTEIENLAYGPASPGNLLDLHIPDVPSNNHGNWRSRGQKKLPVIIYHAGSAWFSNAAKDNADAEIVAAEFTARGYAVATISIRSSSDARFPAQGHDVRAAVRWLRENADEYGLDEHQFAFMGTSSGGWAASFAAMTSDILELPGETGVDGTSSAVDAAVAFFPPTDFLSLDTFAAEHDLPQLPGIYPHDAPTSPEGLLIECPGEVFPTQLVSMQECPEETEAADPTTYIDGDEVPIWVLHGLADPLLPYNQSQLLYEATTAEGNVAKFTLVPDAGHSFEVLDAEVATTRTTNRWRREWVMEGPGPTWDSLERFLRYHLHRANRPWNR